MICTRQTRIGVWRAKAGLWVPRRQADRLACLLVHGFTRRDDGRKYALVTNPRTRKAEVMLLRTLRKKYRRMSDWLGRAPTKQE